MVNKYADDALVMKDSTTPEEFQDFVQYRTQNPYIIDGKMIWNYSSYSVDFDALSDAVENKLEAERYVIPFQVTGVWGYMTNLIPNMISADAKILVYLQDDEEYIVYDNLISEMDQEDVKQFKNELENDISAIDPR